MENSSKKEAREQMASLNEFLAQGNPIVSKGLPKHRVILEGVIDSLSGLADNAQNSSKSLIKAFEAMTELNNRLEKTRELSHQNSNKALDKASKTAKP